jgi:RND family efflux transporter MFP subunit
MSTANQTEEPTDTSGHPYRPMSAPPSESKTGVRVALLFLGVGLIGVFGIIGVRVKQAKDKERIVASQRDEAQAAATRKEPSHVVLPSPVKWKPTIEMTGTLKPWREADLGFETQGRVVGISVSAGDKVRAGQPLATLDSTMAGAQVSQAESQIRAADANLALAEDSLKRTEALFKTNSIPEAQVEQSRSQVALAKAQLDGARASAQVARTSQGLHVIAAPFAGLVTRAPTGVGQIVNPMAGAALIHLEDTSRFRLSATIGEEDIDNVVVNAPVTLTYRDRTVQGRVATVVPSLDQATRRAPVEIEVPNDASAPLMAWGFVRAKIVPPTEVPALKIPANAHKPGTQDEVVIVGPGNKAKVLHLPHWTAEDGSWVIRGGLSEKDSVVVSPSPEAQDGDELEIAK